MKVTLLIYTSLDRSHKTKLEGVDREALDNNQSPCKDTI